MMSYLRRARVTLPLKQYYRPFPRRRLRHDLPHKEYFQNPHTYPAAETSTRELPDAERPVPRRYFRSVLWAGLFATLGFAYVEVPKTAKWVDTGTRDLKREEADMEEIRQKFKDHPLVQVIEADSLWQNAEPAPDPDTEPYPFVEHVDPFMSKAVSGSQGFKMKFYSNPSKAMMCCIVHVGEGVEWGPRTAHAGGLASFIEDSLDFLGSRFTEVTLGKSDESTAILSNKSIQIDFLDDVPTGQIYVFWIMPAIFLGEDISDVLHVKELRGPKLTTDELRRTVIGMLEKRDSLPYEPGNVEQYARARVTYDAPPTKPATRGIIM